MRTVDDLIKHGVRGRRILVRSDLNVPISLGDGAPYVTDDGRIRASLPVLTKLLDHGARVIVAAHLGRPKGERDPNASLSFWFYNVGKRSVPARKQRKPTDHSRIAQSSCRCNR